MMGIVCAYHTEPLSDDIQVRDIIWVPDEQPMVTQTQLQLWQWIANYYMCPIGDVMAAALPAKATDKQYSFAPDAKRRVHLPSYDGEVEPIHSLSNPQQTALNALHEQWKTHAVVLLHGVTSSGKTEVYMHLMQEQLAQGKQVLYLVPEIALTTQLTDRLQHVFGNSLCVYHSRVSDAQRMETYRRIGLDDSRCKVIVGARSAVFLPVTNLGLVIVDEEHEPSYKQQEPAPRYHARSVAIMLAQQLGARVLLGTATPSIETYYNAQQNKYGLVTMTERFAGLQLPKMTFIDLQRQYHRKEMYDHFSDPLVARIREELDKHKQIILFQNRRGYAPMMVCTTCGQSPTCTNCDVPMTLHNRLRQLTCHYCGTSIPVPAVCPHCGGVLKAQGFGTERLEDEVAALFPQARVLRMDLDSTRTKSAYQDIITAFAKHEVDILIGTQMVTKGLHFDDVSLVAVLNADQTLNQPDFRSYERAFQMLEQVSGRAGRKGTQGEVIIQTFNPEHPLFHDLKAHDYQTFYNQQIAERELFHYPPFSRMITITIRHTDEQRVLRTAATLQSLLQQVFGKRCSAVVEPSITKVQRNYLRQLHLRIERDANYTRAKQMLVEQINYVTQQKECKNTTILVDIDPN